MATIRACENGFVQLPGAHSCLAIARGKFTKLGKTRFDSQTRQYVLRARRVKPVLATFLKWGSQLEALKLGAWQMRLVPSADRITEQLRQPQKFAENSKLSTHQSLQATRAESR